MRGVESVMSEQDLSQFITTTSVFGIKQPKMFAWEPQPDISTFELAQAVPVFSMSYGVGQSDFIEALPANVRRHFRESSKT